MMPDGALAQKTHQSWRVQKKWGLSITSLWLNLISGTVVIVSDWTDGEDSGTPRAVAIIDPALADTTSRNLRYGKA